MTPFQAMRLRSTSGVSTINETLIQSTTTSSSATSVTFSTIPGTYKALRLIWSTRQATGAADATLRLQFNGDTGSNYDSNRWNRFGNTNSANGTSASLGSITASNAPSNASTGGELVVPYYASTTFYKAGESIVANQFDQSSIGVIQESTAIVWHSTAAITQIVLTMSNGVAFVDGSGFDLYGMNPS